MGSNGVQLHRHPASIHLDADGPQMESEFSSSKSLGENIELASNAFWKKRKIKRKSWGFNSIALASLSCGSFSPGERSSLSWPLGCYQLKLTSESHATGRDFGAAMLPSSGFQLLRQPCLLHCGTTSLWRWSQWKAWDQAKAGVTGCGWH